MVSSPPRSRADRTAQSEVSAAPARAAQVTAAQAKQAVVPSGAQIAAALLDRSQSARPVSKKRLPDTVDVAGSIPGAGKLRIDKTVCGVETTLHLVGVLSTLTLAQIRDEAFTAIGARPSHLCIDLTGAAEPDAAALDSLVTIASVARIMGITFRVRAPAPLIGVLETTHLSRLIPLDQTNDAQSLPSPHVEWLEAASR